MLLSPSSPSLPLCVLLLLLPLPAWSWCAPGDRRAGYLPSPGIFIGGDGASPASALSFSSASFMAWARKRGAGRLSVPV